MPNCEPRSVKRIRTGIGVQIIFCIGFGFNFKSWQTEVGDLKML